MGITKMKFRMMGVGSMRQSFVREGSWGQRVLAVW
jgi:hypothetical protein